MAATRSSSGRSPANPKKPATVSGRVEKPKKASKTTSSVKTKVENSMSAEESEAEKAPKTISSVKTKVENPMSAEECEAETKLMRRINIGEFVYSNHRDLHWETYTGPCLMGLPKKIKDEIIDLVLPIKQRRDNGHEDYLNVTECLYFPPILQTCRELRYKYGKLFLTNNTFTWILPHSWDATEIGVFQQHAASIGVPDFPLIMELSGKIDDLGFKYHPYVPLEEGCRDRLNHWMKEVFYGVETRVLANNHPLRRDDGLIAHFLHQAQQYRDRGKSWEKLQKSLKETWEAFLERRSLCEKNLGKGVEALTALYKASNDRLESARASGLGVAPRS